jgi:uncharacterized protein
VNYIVTVAFVSLLIGLSKGGLGGPIPVSLITPILSLVMPAPQAVGVTLPLLLFGDVMALKMYWRSWNMQQVKLLLPMGILGVIVGTLLLAMLATRPDDTMLRRTLGTFALIVVLYKLGSDRLRSIRYQPHNWHGYLAGGASGFGSALANAGAAPFTAYMLLQDFTPQMFIGTATLYFAIINLLKLPGVIYLGLLDFRQLVSILWSLPFIPLGVWIGRWLVERINPKTFEWSMLLLLLWMSAVLLFSTPK